MFLQVQTAVHGYPILLMVIPPIVITVKYEMVTVIIGLLFLFIEMKELCEARANLEMSSNLADTPTLADVLPPSQNCQSSK